MEEKTIKIIGIILIIAIPICFLIYLLFIKKIKKSIPIPGENSKNMIQSYLMNVYPTSDKIKQMSPTEAQNFYKNLWFFFLVSDKFGVPSKTDKEITIEGTLMSINNLMAVQYKDGAPFLHPNSIAIKNPSSVFYNKEGKQKTDPNVALQSVSNGKYIEITSFGWNPYPNGIYLNAAKGSGIFWNPGKIVAGYNKVSLIYFFSCVLGKVPYKYGVYTDDGYNAMEKNLSKYDKDGGVMTTLKKLSAIDKKEIKDVVKAHVEDNRTYLSNAEVIKDEAVSSYDGPMKQIGQAAGYDSVMMIAQANGDGSFDIEFCDFRVSIQGGFGSGTINDDIVSKWTEFCGSYLSVRDPFDVSDETKAKSIDVLFPNIMFSGKDAKYHCKAGQNCGPKIMEGYNKNANEYCSITGCAIADSPVSWKKGQTITPYKSTKSIQLFTPGGVMWAVNNSKQGLFMNNKALTTSKILEHLDNENLVTKLSTTQVNDLMTKSELATYLSTLNITKPIDLTTGLKNYFKITYPLSSKFWDELEHNELVLLYLQLNSHYMPLLLPIGKMTPPKCYSPTDCILPPSINSRTQYWAFDGIHIEGAGGSDIGKAAYSTKNYPDSSPYAYQTVGNPFNGGPHSNFDHKNMTFTEGGYPNYAWVESVQYADEAGGIRLQGKFNETTSIVVGPESCECEPTDKCTTYVETPVKEGFTVYEGFTGDIPCDNKTPCTVVGKKTTPCSIGQKCSGTGCNSYCTNPDAYTSCALTYNGETPPTTSTCGSFDMKNQKWNLEKCSDVDQCKWTLTSGNKQSYENLIACIDKPTDENSCGVPFSVKTKGVSNSVTVPVISTMYYPQQGYGRFTNYGKTGIYYSNVSLLLTIPDLNLRMTMEQIIQLVGKAVGGLSIYHQLQALLNTKQKDPRQYLAGYVVLPNTEYTALKKQSPNAKIYKINNKRNIVCENPLINPQDDPILTNIAKNFTALYIPPEENLTNPQYNKTLKYEYDTAIQLLMAMYIHGCTGNHGQKDNYPFGSYNSYGMVIGHLAYVRTKAMGWNTVQLARDPDYSGNSMKYCEWPFYDYEIIHVAAQPPSWFKPNMAKASNPSYPNETDGYGFDLSVGGVWADQSAAKPYVFCKGMFTLDITKYLSFYAVNGYIPGTGNWNNDVELLNPQNINRNIFRQGQLTTDKYATAIRPYYTPTQWNQDPIVYDQTCPFTEWKGNSCSSSDDSCVVTKQGNGIYYQAMNSTTPIGTWPIGSPVKQ